MRDCCYKCHKWKVVKLCANDLLCSECDEKNEAALKLIAIEKAGSGSHTVDSGTRSNNLFLLDARKKADAASSSTALHVQQIPDPSSENSSQRQHRTSLMASASQPSQTERLGTCSVCLRPRMRLYDGGQFVYRHGPHSKPCSGTGKPPLNRVPDIQLSAQPANNTTHRLSTVISDLPLKTVTPICHPTLHSGTIKHIPKAARATCSTKLSDLLEKVTSNLDDPLAWMDLLYFGPTILGKPPRTGKRHNLSTAIKKRCISEESTEATIKVYKTKPNRDPDASMAAAVSSKIEEGNLKAAIRIISSDEKIAAFSSDNLEALRQKHPTAPTNQEIFPDRNTFVACQASDEMIRKAIFSFPAGSSGGPDGLRPAHISELIRNKETSDCLLSSVCNLINALLQGKCPPSIQKILFGGKLLALNKPDGGLRPIAIGYYWRRLAAKCANSIALKYLGNYFSPIQLGVGVKGGCEAAIHATRRFCSSMPSDHILVKLDFQNAFNSIHREAVLHAVANHIPALYPFCHLTYSSHTSLTFGDGFVSSEDGVQQGDPLGPLLFCLTIHPLLISLQSNFKVCFMDDLTLGGTAKMVERDIERTKETGAALGLWLNSTKCELLQADQRKQLHLNRDSPMSLFKQLDIDSAYLLGAPIMPGNAMNSILTARVQDLERAVTRLCLIDSQDALLILRSAYSSPKLQNVLRSSPCSGHPTLAEFDKQLRIGLSSITNCEITDIAWIQASQPIRCSGLGVRSVEMLAPSAYLASAAATLTLQNDILALSLAGPDQFIEATMEI